MKSEQKHSLMPSVITLALTAMVSGLLWALFTMEIPESNREYTLLLLGSVFAIWSSSINYWVGSTRSSADKDRVIKKL